MPLLNVFIDVGICQRFIITITLFYCTAKESYDYYILCYLYLKFIFFSIFDTARLIIPIAQLDLQFHTWIYAAMA